ncbi:MAG TPA: hypothetical protein VHH53_07370, partial [Pseudonocardiaceae bacterium]|nr:hypothetical protein [Pseudonocardiaceae bacterium]
MDQSNPHLRECVAEVAVAVRGDRSVRLARGGVTALAVLFIALAMAAVVVVDPRNQVVATQHTAVAGGMVAQAEYLDQPRRLGQPLTGYAGAVTGVAFSADGRILATSPIMLWDLSDRSRPRRL